MCREPLVERVCRVAESVGQRIPVDSGADEHHSSREKRREPHAHFVQDDSGEDKEEDEYVQECLGALHGSEGQGVPAAGLLKKIFDWREYIHEDIRAEHCEGEQRERRPSGPCLVV